MGSLGDFVRRHRVLAAFAAGAALTLAGLALVGYLVLADQRRSARVLGAALSRALAREVRIERVTELGPSRVVMRGVRLPAERGWPADVSVETIEASGPLLAAARGEPAPVRLVVTRPTVAAAAGGGAGVAALDGLRQGLERLLAGPGLFDVSVTGGVLDVPGGDEAGLTFDLTLRKGAGDARAELLLHPRRGPPLTVTLDARAEGDTAHVSVAGAGRLDPLAPWLPAGLVRAGGGAPLDLRLAVALRPGDRGAGRVSARLGAFAAFDGALGLEAGLVRLGEAHGEVDLPFVAAAAGLRGAAAGRVQLADGEVAWRPGSPGLPAGEATLRLADGVLPAEALGAGVRVSGMEARLVLEAAERGAALRGDVRAERLRAADVELAPVESGLRLALDGAGAVTRAELSGLSARLAGAPVRGTIAYDVPGGRADARMEADGIPLDGLARRLAPGWLGAADRLRAGGIRVTVTGLAPRGLGEGRAEAVLRDLALRRPDGEATLGQARVRATLEPGRTALTATAERVRSSLPILDGLLPRLEATVDLARDGGAAELARLSMVARDAAGGEMLRADAGRADPAVRGGPVRLTARAPALERLATLWPSVPRRITGTGTLVLEAPDLRFAAFAGRLALEVPEADLLGGRLSLRALSAELPVGHGPGAAAAAAGPLALGELVGYGVVAHDLVGRARVVDRRLTVSDLRYAVYSGEGDGSLEATAGPGGLSARARLAGEGVRVEEFIGAYGIRGGTMTGLLRYDLDVRYAAGRLGADGTLAVPDGGTITIELLERLFQYTEADPTGVVRRALENLRAFDYKSADATVRTAADDIRVSLSLRGRERFGIFPPRVKEINIRDMPLGFLARQFPSR